MLKRKNVSITRCIAVCGMLSAASVVLQFFEFPLPFLIPGFIKMDFSDLPALLASFALGPLPGIAVCAVKNLIHLLVTTTGGVGEFANFLLSSVFVFIAGSVYHFIRNRKGALAGSLVGALWMGLFSIPINLFITYPFYYGLMPKEAILGAYQSIVPLVGSIFECVTIFNYPFTFMKGVFCTVIALLIYKPLSPLLKGKQNKKYHD